MHLGRGGDGGSLLDDDISHETMGMKQTYHNKTYRGCDLLGMGVVYIGLQERGDKPLLEMFNDLETKSTFLRMEEETVLEARDRIRKGYKKK